MVAASTSPNLSAARTCLLSGVKAVLVTFLGTLLHVVAGGMPQHTAHGAVTDRIAPATSAADSYTHKDAAQPARKCCPHMVWISSQLLQSQTRSPAALSSLPASR